MRYYWWCLTCGKQGRVGKGYRYLNRSLSEHTKSNHPDDIVIYLTINEYGVERMITYEK